MTLKGWSKIRETPIRDIWENTWFPKVTNSVNGKKYPNVVEVIKTVGGWWQVWAASAPVSEIGSAKTKAAAVKKAVAFMKKYPAGHPAGQPQ